jgi:hypothetical protein
MTSFPTRFHPQVAALVCQSPSSDPIFNEIFRLYSYSIAQRLFLFDTQDSFPLDRENAKRPGFPGFPAPIQEPLPGPRQDNGMDSHCQYYLENSSISHETYDEEGK